MPWLSHVHALLLLPAAISAVTLDCKHIRADDQSFNFQELGGPKEVNWQQHTPPTITNTTFTIDICSPLKRTKEKQREQCPTGTRVCGVKRIYDDDTYITQEVIPIAGEYALTDARHLSPKFTRLKDSESNSDAGLEGVRGELHGGRWNKQDQKAIIEFLCDRDWEGTEGFDDGKKTMDVTSYGSMDQKRAAEDGDDDGDDTSPLPDLDKGKALQFESYKSEKDTGVLRLTWKTRYACEGEASKVPSNKSGGGGFFKWLVIVVFLGVAAYIIFGSWLNYNRYGARGWDLIPHGDTIRDIPYIVKDMGSSVMDKLKGGQSSRGGYSAV